MSTKLKLLVIPGSLRKASYNKSLARYVKNNPEDFEVEIFELNEVPLFNIDDEADGLPEGVTKLYEKIEWADAITFVTPEYNRSFSGVLKNAIDWVSREPLLVGKPVSIMGASDGPFGTARAQLMLKPVLVDQQAIVMGKPEVLIPEADMKFDNKGNLTDEKAKQKIAEQLTAFKIWMQRFVRN